MKPSMNFLELNKTFNYEHRHCFCTQTQLFSHRHRVLAWILLLTTVSFLLNIL